MSHATWYRWQGEVLVLTLHIQPGASSNEVVGPHGDALKVGLKAPPVDGKANALLCSWFAEICHVPKRQVSLLSGQTDRRKRLAIQSPQQLPPGVHPST